MTKKKRSIIFVSHNASRTGAPMILLGLIKELAQSSEWDIQILLMEAGPLEAEFHRFGKVYVWYKEPVFTLSAKRGFSRLLSQIKYKLRGKRILSQLKKSEVVFLNTITNGHVHKKLLGKADTFITYVHELQTSIKMNTDRLSLNTVIGGSNHFFCGSNAVKEMLVEKYEVPAGKTSVVYSSLQLIELEKINYQSDIDKLRERFRIPESAIIIGLSGTTEWRKGIDWLYPLVKLYFKKRPNGNAYFIWKGIDVRKSDYFERFDFEKSKLTHRVIFLPHGNDALATIAAYDIHLLLSREDPYPLVVLEAAAFGIPSVCFKGAGGSPEFIEGDAGIAVEYGDLDAVADAIIYLETDSGRRKELGSVAKNKLKGTHHSSNAASILTATIDKLKTVPVA
ncbi:MAG: glycosyltransferase family 4 protein [Chitinophagaceae bacterium]|nr:glycosyltransferase family 4 protein [Chitinophagaceae bacterium]